MASEKYYTSVDNIVQSVVSVRNDEIVIHWGDEAPPNAEDVPAKDMWSVTYSPTGDRVGVTNTDSCLSSIAQREWGSELFYLPDSKLDIEMHRYMSKGVPLWYFFPIIMVDTYKRMQADSSYYVDILNPNLIKAGYNLSIPQLTVEKAKDYIGNRSVIQIFQDVDKYYQNVGEQSFAQAFNDIATYLEHGSKQ